MTENNIITITDLKVAFFDKLQEISKYGGKLQECQEELKQIENEIKEIENQVNNDQD